MAMELFWTRSRKRRSRPATTSYWVTHDSGGHPDSATLHVQGHDSQFLRPELRIQQDIVPGIDIPLHFTATKTGRWEIVCTQLCGLGHYSMKAYLEVKSQSEYDEWPEAAIWRLIDFHRRAGYFRGRPPEASGEGTRA